MRDCAGEIDKTWHPVRPLENVVLERHEVQIRAIRNTIMRKADTMQFLIRMYSALSTIMGLKIGSPYDDHLRTYRNTLF